ncbi:TonB-dependent receptor [Pedobacter glucosidilyticus]|uniref:TonB-dependent receptor n=1 Tax=Pedobacter glucosidilyticus TaxID=1122941 RepID=UPI0004040BB5|nr:TonB-dependent receptor [Pedobacter glucosidilyticus]
MKRIILSLLILFCTVNLFAQSSVNVLLNTEDKKPLSGYNITLKNLLTDSSFTAITNKNGLALFKNVKQGEYQIQALSRLNYAIENRTLVVDSALETNITLIARKKDFQELNEISVIADKALKINKTDAAVSSYISKKEIQNLPIEGRDVTKSLYRLPNLTISTLGYNEAPTIAINGLSGIYTNYMIDGLDNNERFLGNSKFNTPFGFTESITVLTNNYSVEYGNTSNGIVNVETRSGSNDFTGEVFYLTRPGSIVDSRSAFASLDLYGNPVKDGFQRQQLGVGLGGALKKDKTFFYLNFEQTFDIKDNLLNVPELGVNEAIRGNNSFSYLSTKIDQIWSDKFKSSLRVNYGSFDIDQQGGGLTGGNNFPSSASTQKNRTYLIALKNSYQLGARLKGETNYQNSYFRWNYRDRPNIGKPGVSVQDLTGRTIATIGSIDYIFDDDEYTNQIQQKFRLEAGKHNFLFGTEFTTSNFSLLGAGNSYGFYTVRLNPQQLADLRARNIGSALDIDDIPADVEVLRYQVDLDQSRFGTRQNVFNLYAEDNFKLNDKLDINLGVRFDYDNLSKAGSTRGDWNNIGPRTSFNYKLDDKNVIRGGIGRFYDKIKYSVTSDNLQFSNNSDNFKRQLAELQRLGILDANADLDRITHPGNLRAVYADAITSNNPAYLQGASAETAQGKRADQSNANFRIKNPNGYQNPYSDQYSIGYQRKINENVLFYVDLVHTRTQNLYRITNLNAPKTPFNLPANAPAESAKDPNDANLDRPVPIVTVNGQFQAKIGSDQIGGIARDVFMTETEGKARYTAANFSMVKVKGVNDQFSYRISYSLSKIMNDTEGINVRAQDANNWANEYAFGDNDRTHVINALFTWYPVKNLTLTPALLFQSGQPITYYANSTAYFYNRKDANGNFITVPDPTPTDPNRTAKVPVRSGDLNGNGETPGFSTDIQPGETRNNGRLPNATTIDFSAKYRLKLKNKSGIEFSADIYNLLNQTNLTGFASTRGASNQVQIGPRSANNLNIRAAAPPRQFQFGMRYIFGNY